VLSFTYGDSCGCVGWEEVLDWLYYRVNNRVLSITNGGLSVFLGREEVLDWRYCRLHMPCAELYIW